MLIVQGDFNAKVGRSDTGSTECCGNWGLGVRNEAGDKLVDFATENGLAIMNTRFQQHNRRLYTWTSPDGHSKNQIDYILAKQRWKTSIRNCRTYPGADCGSDHQLLMAKVQLKLKVLPKPDDAIRFQLYQNTDEYAVQIANRFQALSCLEEESTPNQIWQQMKETLLQTAEETLGRRKKQKRKPWISDEVLELAEVKRSLKQQRSDDAIQEYRKTRNRIQQLCRRDKEAYLNKVCSELEDANRTGNSKSTYAVLKSLTRDFKPTLKSVKGRTGEFFTTSEEITKRWK